MGTSPARTLEWCGLVAPGHRNGGIAPRYAIFGGIAPRTLSNGRVEGRDERRETNGGLSNGYSVPPTPLLVRYIRPVGNPLRSVESHMELGPWSSYPFRVGPVGYPPGARPRIMACGQSTKCSNAA
jgi:hypothetical protein